MRKEGLGKRTASFAWSALESCSASSYTTEVRKLAKFSAGGTTLSYKQMSSSTCTGLRGNPSMTAPEAQAPSLGSSRAPSKTSSTCASETRTPVLSWTPRRLLIQTVRFRFRERSTKAAFAVFPLPGEPLSSTSSRGACMLARSRRDSRRRHAASKSADAFRSASARTEFEGAARPTGPVLGGASRASASADARDDVASEATKRCVPPRA